MINNKLRLYEEEEALPLEEEKTYAGGTNLRYGSGRVKHIQTDEYKTVSNPYESALANAMSKLNNASVPSGNYGGSEWDSLRDRLAREYINSSFEDYKGTDAYKGLENQYQKNGQLAMDNAMSQLAARTGGLASSYAQQVGQQEYNNELDALQEAAYSMYNSEQEKKYNDISVASNMADEEYNKWLNNYNSQLDSYNALVDNASAINDSYNKFNTEYQTNIDTYLANAKKMSFEDAKKYLGDLNDKGLLDVEDMFAIVDEINPENATQDETYNSQRDYNNDGKVDGQDYYIRSMLMQKK